METEEEEEEEGEAGSMWEEEQQRWNKGKTHLLSIRSRTAATVGPAPR